MTDVLVIAAAAAMSAALLWFFFGSRPAARLAEVAGRIQQVTVTVRGGYTPSRIEAVAGAAEPVTISVPWTMFMPHSKPNSPARSGRSSTVVCS